jgi:pyrroline-5-carboxylate reductase
VREKLAAFGCGEMVSAILEGYVSSRGAPSERDSGFSFLTFTPSRTRAETLAARIQGDVLSGFEDLSEVKYVLLGCKPQQFRSETEGLAADLKGKMGSDAVVISVLAGISVHEIQKELSISKVIRVMPNTPISVQAGVSLFFSSLDVSEAEKNKVASLFEAASDVFWLNSEREMDLITGVSGSGPAYLFEFARVMEAWLVQKGIAEETATMIVRKTIQGSGMLMLDAKGESLESLREKVTSKKGVTFEALMTLKKQSFEPIIHLALEAAYRRTEEISRQES